MNTLPLRDCCLPIRKLLAVTAIPLMIGTFSFVTPQANAEPPSNRIAQSQQPNRPQNRPQRPDEKRQDKHSKPRPHQQKRTPQPSHQKKRTPQPPQQRPQPRN